MLFSHVKKNSSFAMAFVSRHLALVLKCRGKKTLFLNRIINIRMFVSVVLDLLLGPIHVWTHIASIETDLISKFPGSRSSRAKPLHWTSCLKIAEDVAQGLYYIHQSSSALVHGNLKSTNILLGQDFEACLTDYCLSVLTGSSSSVSPDDADSSSYKAPEIRKSSRRPTAKCDVYSFGVLIFELLTGKNSSRHPFMAPRDMLDWVRAMREEEEGSKDNRLGMMTETACLCRVTSPEQRPTMRQVIKMIQEIKESVMAEENDPLR